VVLEYLAFQIREEVVGLLVCLVGLKVEKLQTELRN
jgi:hypothetical protein